MLLLIYVFLLFLLLGVIAKFMGALINYSKIGVWDFSWADVVDMLPGVYAYAIPTGVGVWIQSWLKNRKERESNDKDSGQGN
ncbi:hypothetical protein J1G34_14385 [Pseudomonas sp. Wu6]|uniref:hypothetical protein n=1 Tax=unclassified Pseudomonas TaxID=196821 RepID=UPI0011121C1D|nr:MULTISPECIES: hypothetical protein [unclassified Pseudomonas]MBY8930230.1 hypothetical protein [Pseudomonas sp. Wu6]